MSRSIFTCMHASDSKCKLMWSKSSHCSITTLLYNLLDYIVSPILFKVRIMLEWPRIYKLRLSILVPVYFLTLLKNTISPDPFKIVESRAANIAPESNPSLTISPEDQANEHWRTGLRTFPSTIDDLLKPVFYFFSKLVALRGGVDAGVALACKLVCRELSFVPYWLI